MQQDIVRGKDWKIDYTMGLKYFNGLSYERKWYGDIR